MGNDTIAVIGGGMVGASLGLILARALPDAIITLVESRPFAATANDALTQSSFDGRSTALAPSAAAVMATLGIWDELSRYATPIEAIHVSDRGHWGLSQFNRGDNADSALGYVVENAGFGRVLQQALRHQSNIQIMAPAQVKHLQPVAEGMQVQLEDRLMVVDLAIVADGADSPLRQQLGIAVDECCYHQHALVANVTYSQPHAGRAFERFTASGPLALLPLGRSASAQTSALVWTIPDDDIDAIMACDDVEILARLQATFGYRLGRFTQISRRAAYPLRLVVAKEQVRNGLVLMGNAAHFIHPVAGQGFNLALRDGLRLAETLVAGRKLGQRLGSLRLLQDYLQAQSQDQARTIFLSDGFNKVFTHKSGPWRWGRDLAMLALEFAPPLRSAFIQQLSGKTSRLARPWS